MPKGRTGKAQKGFIHSPFILCRYRLYCHMTGTLTLIGSGEFLPGMVAMNRAILERIKHPYLRMDPVERDKLSKKNYRRFLDKWRDRKNLLIAHR